jgi:hypothetical protein
VEAIVDRERVAELYKEETSAFYRYMAEKNGDPVRPTDLKNRAISPKRVREAEQDWHSKVAALRAAGGTPEIVRELLQERGR